MTTLLESPRTEATSPAPLQKHELETWAASRARMQKEQKDAMAAHFAEHDFLLSEGASPAKGPRETAACILVNQGTGPNVVVSKSLDWIAQHSGDGPFHITWYSPSALVPATLYEFRKNNPNMSAASHVHLFPGGVDIHLQAQVSTEAQEYARQLTRRFSYMILSAHSFDLQTGEVLFNFEREKPIQRTCALLRAAQKYLFLDSQKFTGEGEIGYSLRDLLPTCNAVIIYTVSSPRIDEIKAAFNRLASTLLSESPADEFSERKTLRLTVVGLGGEPSQQLSRAGFLVPDTSPGRSAR